MTVSNWCRPVHLLHFEEGDGCAFYFKVNLLKVKYIVYLKDIVRMFLYNKSTTLAEMI